MNNHVLKIKGSAELPDKLEDETEYIIKVRGTTDGVSRDPNHDGTYTYTYKFGLETADIEMTGGKIQKVVRKGSQSQKMRAMILSQGLDYERTMSKIMDNFEEILEIIK